MVRRRAVKIPTLFWASGKKGVDSLQGSKGFRGKRMKKITGTLFLKP